MFLLASLHCASSWSKEVLQWSNSSSYLLSCMLLLTSTAVCPTMFSVSIVAISLAEGTRVREGAFGMGSVGMLLLSRSKV